MPSPFLGKRQIRYTRSFRPPDLPCAGHFFVTPRPAIIFSVRRDYRPPQEWYEPIAMGISADGEATGKLVP